MSKTRQQTRDEWFAGNLDAQAALEEYLTQREENPHAAVGLGEFSTSLMDRFGYPFGPGRGMQDTNFGRWVRDTYPGRGSLKTTAEAQPETVAAKAPKVTLGNVTFPLTEKEREAVEAHGTYVVTSAQNDTEPDANFLSALERYAEERNAKLLVIPVRYKNPTSRRDPQESNDGASWHPRVMRYLCDEDLHVHDGLRILGRPRIQAMSPQPLGGMESISQGASAIFGHPQLSMKAVATPQSDHAKLLYTTGSVTKKNGSLTALGYRGTFHQSHAAIVVEVRGARTHMRELVWSGRNQNFHDLDRVYTTDGSQTAPPVEALITGDEHVWFNDPKVRAATYDGPESIAARLVPRLVVRHDVLDCYSISHHHEKNAIVRAMKAKYGRDDIRQELDDTLRFIELTTPPGAMNIIVPSNHHDHLLQWLKAPGHIDPRNSEIYYELMYRVLKEARMLPNRVVHPDPFELYSRDKLLVDATFLSPDESYRVLGIELGMHGHMGPNGARGSARNISAVGTRSVIGHSHTPAIYQGVYQTGTSSYLRLDYNPGPSSWTQTHVVIHANGKRQMIHIIDGHWRG